MAIIYTYPRLLNPDGTELIVVSETKNQNATRLLTVGAIVDLFNCDECDFCADAIYSIIPPLGEEVVADGCDQINFTSSDASVTITGTNATKTVDFKAVGAGGGCPPTYLIRPIECDPETYECTISTRTEYWVYTCDPTLGALAPGYINTLQINGVNYPHPIEEGEQCWYIELATLTANTTDCETCCPEPELVYKLTPCGDGDKYWTNDANSSGPAGTSISDYDGQVILATTPAGTYCYTVSQELDTISPVTILVGGYEDCECCEYLGLVQIYRDCGDITNTFKISLTQPQLDDLIANGVASIYYYLRVDLGLPGYVCVEWYGPACSDADTEMWDTNPSSCGDQAWCPPETILLTPCEGNDQGYTSDIVTNESESPTLVGVNTDDIVSLDAVNKACYMVTRPVYLPLSGGPVTVVETFTTPNECQCCQYTVRKYEECNSPGSYVYFDLDNSPSWYWDKNSPPPCLKAEFPTDVFTCYQFVDCEQGEVFTPDSLVECDPDCETDPACAPENIRYEQCNEQGQDPPGTMLQYLHFQDNGSMPDYIIVTNNSGGGSSWCYFKNPLDNQPETPDYTWVTKDPQNCDPCEVYEYFNCLAPEVQLYTANSAITDIGYDNPNAWAHAGDVGGCYQTVGPVSLPIIDLTLNEITLTASFPDCDCCTSTGGAPGGMGYMHQYVLCEYPAGAPAGAPADVTVDLSTWIPLGEHPDVISVTINGIDVCYQWDMQVCIPATHGYVGTFNDCEECIEAEGEPYVVEVKECNSATTWYVPSSCFNPSLYDAGIVNGDVIEVTSGPLYDQHTGNGCFEIININSNNTTTLACPPDNVWTGPIAANAPAELDECQCCEQKLYNYTKCDPGGACDVSVAADILVDLGPNGANIWPTIPAVIRATDLSSGFDCCFENPTVPDPECDTPTGTYVSTPADCNGPCV